MTYNYLSLNIELIKLKVLSLINQKYKILQISFKNLKQVNSLKLF